MSRFWIIQPKNDGSVQSSTATKRRDTSLNLCGYFMMFNN